MKQNASATDSATSVIGGSSALFRSGQGRFSRPEVAAILPAWRADVTLDALPVEVIGFADHATYRERWPLLEMQRDAWDRVRAFELQYDAEGTWKTAAAGARIGPRRELTFSPVTARKFRLLITESADVPTICEFALHGE